MLNFELDLSTKIFFGRDTELQVGRILKESNAKKVLFHYGGGSIKKTGLYEKVVKSLEENNISFIEFSGVQPNPRLSMVNEGIKICKSQEIDFILAVGGGSVIDSAKAIAAGFFYNGDVWDLFKERKDINKALPIGTVLTIPAAGSEMSMFTVVTNDISENIRKLGYGSPCLKPIFSILNPELTFSLPRNQTTYGVVDMFAHIVERYFTNTENCDLTDKMCEAVMKSIIYNSKKVIKDPNNYDARAEIMLAGTIAHNNILGIGRLQDWSSHGIEHELSAKYDIAHGEGLAIVIPAWMKFVSQKNPGKFLQYGKNVFELSGEDNSVISCAIEKTEEFFKELGLGIKLSEIDLFPNDEDIDYMSSQATNNPSRGNSDGTIGNYVRLSKKDIVEIFKKTL